MIKAFKSIQRQKLALRLFKMTSEIGLVKANEFKKIYL